MTFLYSLDRKLSWGSGNPESLCFFLIFPRRSQALSYENNGQTIMIMPNSTGNHLRCYFITSLTPIDPFGRNLELPIIDELHIILPDPLSHGGGFQDLQFPDPGQGVTARLQEIIVQIGGMTHSSTVLSRSWG